ncbi:MAG: trypsin-like peptidase domain-containing protein [Chloroflexi bacterium]|nr:trypsin-like peptidase domain-containing protein [Chloroflexota bacterium]
MVLSHRLELGIASVAVVLVVATVSGCAEVLSEIAEGTPSQERAPAPTSGPSTTTTTSLAATNLPGVSTQQLPDIATVVEAVRPAVVSIKAVSLQENFFGLVPQEGQGSGFVIDSAGHVITNAHVVGNAETVSVTLPDGRVFENARVVGRDEPTDLAVIRVEGQNLPVARVGQSKGLRVGDWVVAIGNALALPEGPTVTAGILSATGRGIGTDTGCELKNLLQTDAAINPGNSGGPLFNLRGEVIGINTAVQRGVNGVVIEGIGFAIAVDEAMPIVRELVEFGRVVRPWLGVGLESNSRAFASRYDLPTDQGVVITEVRPRSPAAGAGLRPGWVVLTADGQPVTNAESLSASITGRKVGGQMRLTGLTRAGQDFNVQIRLGQNPRTSC